MVQVRNVPDGVHRKLKARAALAVVAVGYILKELERSLERPTREELLERLGARPPVAVKPRPASAVRAERGAR